MKKWQISDTRERVAELHAKGLNGSEIARVLDVSATRVYAVMDKLGIPRGRKTPENGSETPLGEESEVAEP